MHAKQVLYPGTASPALECSLKCVIHGKGLSHHPTRPIRNLGEFICQQYLPSIVAVTSTVYKLPWKIPVRVIITRVLAEKVVGLCPHGDNKGGCEEVARKGQVPVLANEVNDR